ncbi:MAG: hypothetical protein H7144_06865 [Burkholderiales bacterium]|nr:hypothetical protein [Phycisphaerae bacterium]
MNLVTIPEFVFPATLKRFGVTEDEVREAIIERTYFHVVIDTDSDAWPDREVIVAEPVPAAEWPAWALSVADMRDVPDAGVGDTVHRMLGELGVIAKATLKSIGVPCGCDKRQTLWNARYPYNSAG